MSEPACPCENPKAGHTWDICILCGCGPVEGGEAVGCHHDHKAGWYIRFLEQIRTRIRSVRDSLFYDMIARASSLYRAMEGNAAGGSLHIAIEDGNWNSASILFCHDLAKNNGDAAGQALAHLLLHLPFADIVKAFGLERE